MLTFYIVRHGETLFNQKHLMQGWCDSPLTTQGIQMASDLGIRLKDIPFEAAYSSTSERAMDSAELIMKENNTPIPITIRKELKEIHFGIMEGENEYVGRVAKQHEYHRYGWVNDGGENPEMVWQRVSKVLDEMIQTYQDGNILIVTHGVVMMTLLRKLKPGYMESQRKDFHIANCAVMKMEYHDQAFHILAVNQ